MERWLSSICASSTSMESGVQIPGTYIKTKWDGVGLLRNGTQCWGMEMVPLQFTGQSSKPTQEKHPMLIPATTDRQASVLICTPHTHTHRERERTAWRSLKNTYPHLSNKVHLAPTMCRALCQVLGTALNGLPKSPPSHLFYNKLQIIFLVCCYNNIHDTG